MNKRTPGMYAFYEREIRKAIQEENWEEYSRLIDDAPKSIIEALARNEIIEESVEASRG